MKNMKRVSVYLLILFAAFFPAIQSPGQSDSAKKDSKIPGEVVKKSGTKDVGEYVNFSDRQEREKRPARIQIRANFMGLLSYSVDIMERG